MTAFSRSRPAQAKAPCVACCRADMARDDELGQAAAARIAALAGPAPARRPSHAALAPSPAYGGPSGRIDSDCARQATALAPVLQRFERYREALPSARAAADLSDLGDRPGTSPVTRPCLSRLPADAAGLSAALGMREGHLRDEDLRNDATGFRAALYRDEGTGKLILVPRDTQPDSLEDWATNTDNGVGKDTKQYAAMRRLTRRLADAGQSFDIAGYSKGGGLAQEGGLVSALSQVRVFNSAGLPDNALGRADATSFDSLSARTRAFSAEGDFLTFMNDTTDPGQVILNSRFLERELAGEGPGLDPINIKVRNPAMRGAADPSFTQAKADYIAGLDRHIDELQAAYDSGGAVAGFPAVRAATHETVAGSMTAAGRLLGAGSDQPTLGKLAQHKMSAVLDGLESSVARDRQALSRFLASCG